jgi:hypothetical protein
VFEDVKKIGHRELAALAIIEQEENSFCQPEIGKPKDEIL